MADIEETPEELRLRLHRESMARGRARKRAAATGEAGPPLQKRGGSVPKYTPEEAAERLREQKREGQERYRATPEGAAKIAKYRRSDEFHEWTKQYQSKPEVKAKRAALARERYAAAKLQREQEQPPPPGSPPFTSGGGPDAAQRNRERIAAEQGKQAPRPPTLHPWWKKLW